MANPKATEWRNRIVGQDEVDPEQLLANPRNYRIHPKYQQEAIKGILGSVGWVQRVIVNRATGFVVDGHARVAVAIREKQPTVPVTYVDLTDNEEALILATLDPISALATTDADLLDQLVSEVQTEDLAVQAVIAGFAERSGVVPPSFADSGGVDRLAEWAGMPEYEQDNAGALRQIIVSFATHEDVAAFARLLGQEFSDRTKSIWYPHQPRQDWMEVAYVTEGDA